MKNALDKTNKKKFFAQFDTFILTVGELFTFSIATLVSLIVNVIFIGNLSVTSFVIGPIVISAPLFYAIMSITLDFAKILSVTKMNTLKELHRKLSAYEWSKRIKGMCNMQRSLYILYVILAIITSISLATISISGAINLNQNQSAYITTVRNELIEMRDERNELKNDTRALTKEQRGTSKSVDDVWLEVKKEIIDPLVSIRNASYNEETKDYDYDPIPFQDAYQRYTGVRRSGAQLARMSLSQFRADYKIDTSQKYIESNNVALDEINELIDKRILSLNESGNIMKPNHDPYPLNEDVDMAINELEALKQLYNTDDGDMGRSSKLFILVAEMINKDGKMKVSVEVLMMCVLFFLSLLVELTIYQTSPKVKISRKMLYKFSHLLPPGFDIDDFMRTVDEELIKFDMLDVSRDTEVKAIRRSINNDVERKPRKKKSGYSDKVDKLVNDIEDIIQ